jgi:hypothetical protein
MINDRAATECRMTRSGASGLDQIPQRIANAVMRAQRDQIRIIYRNYILFPAH